MEHFGGMDVLRALAEDELKRRPARARTRTASRVLHELDLHQVELELQNEALRDLQQELEESRARYRKFFDLSPVALLVLTDTGRIIHANVAATRLLAADSSSLLGTFFAKYLTPDGAEPLELHRREVVGESGQGQVRLRLRDPSGARGVRLDSVRADPTTGEWIASLFEVEEEEESVEVRDDPILQERRTADTTRPPARAEGT